ncbi:Rhs element Vgr protein [Candidatus Vecturithrix granuli]|uniref:Rhs element Vgr protein n=1 Tax=Vecturithrix granuli TaxID=1499967 RepID=A0A081C213_VECG1|nr:Rhs element Vgr protein [Candidatus Vecturithrix granuli]
MTSMLFETIQRIIQEELGRIRTAELAIVQDQHPHASESDKDNYACTVRLRNSDIVLKQVPVATSRIGSVSIPAVGDLVLVQFIDGDINAPIITGRLYNDEDRPPVNDDGQCILHVPLGVEESGAVHIELHSGDRREIIVKLGSGISVNLRDDDPVLEMDVDGGKATVKIDRDGAITLESQGNIKMMGKEITIDAQSQLNLKGKTAVNIN